MNLYIRQFLGFLHWCITEKLTSLELFWEKTSMTELLTVNLSDLWKARYKKKVACYQFLVIQCILSALSFQSVTVSLSWRFVEGNNIFGICRMYAALVLRCLKIERLVSYVINMMSVFFQCVT